MLLEDVGGEILSFRTTEPAAHRHKRGESSVRRVAPSVLLRSSIKSRSSIQLPDRFAILLAPIFKY
jgi:hypothetical protein